mmetsp:Transcript_23829/g.56251  ORF Transcript_23829/g.56251 Transcript_23829/m.56251 type:complete len:1080 (+) Transcript_23829:22-3261(+)
MMNQSRRIQYTKRDGHRKERGNDSSTSMNQVAPSSIKAGSNGSTYKEMEQQQHHRRRQRRGMQHLVVSLILLLLPLLGAVVDTTSSRHIAVEAFVFSGSLASATRTAAAATRHHQQRLAPVLYAANDDDEDEDLDLINGADDETTTATVPEPFESESSIAEAANELAAATAGSTNIELHTELETSFLQYALSIILGRALPDGRDGLKPVHRRLLYAMYRLGLLPSSSHRKCARVVGEVLGKFHPHGDQAVYDALVRMAQDFSTHYRLIDGHGNFGSIDNDPAAAMRYTECKLTPLALSALGLSGDELDADTIDFIPNFDGNEKEPTVLPAKLPLLLLNGSSGIAVGMATNIPPHNLREIMAACETLIKKERLTSASSSSSSRKGVTDKELLKLVPGPDFPTAAHLMGTKASEKLYMTGNGGVTLRAVTQVEQQSTTRGRSAIVVTELPYQVNKAALLEQIAALVNDKKLEGIADLRDESDRDGIRVVLELKRDAVPAIVLNNLYKKTKLQTVFSGNFVALMKPKPKGSNNSDGVAIEDKIENHATSSSSSVSSSLTPQRFTLRESLNYFLDFRFETIRRKSAFQLEKVAGRTHIVDGLLLALSRVDDIIEMIRKAPDMMYVRETLMQQPSDGKAPSPDDASSVRLGLSREQADSVLKLQLGQLTRLNQDKLESEKADLESRREELERLLEEDDAVYDVMLDECQEMSDKFGEDRKTKILSEEGELEDIDMIKNSRSVVVVTRGGYIKRMPLKTFEAQGRGTRGKRGTSTDSSSSSSSSLSKGEEDVLHCITCNDHDTLLMITQRGIAYGIPTYQIPKASRTAKGSPLPSVLPIEIGQVVTAVLPVQEFDTESFLVLATKQGMIKKTPLNAFEKISSRGLTIAKLNPGDELQWCQKCTDEDDVLISSTGAMAVRFPSKDLRPASRTTRGVKAMKLKEGDSIADMNIVYGDNTDGVGDKGEDDVSNSDSKEFVLCVTEQGFGKRVPTSAFRSGSRGNQGVIAAKFKKRVGPKEDRISCFTIVHEDDEILAITAKGVMVRQRVSQIPIQSRTATGVVVQKVGDADYIASVSLVPKGLVDGEQ